MRRLLREPLVQFLLGGAALFLLYGVLGGRESPDSDRIVVSEARVASLAATFERTWMRPPTAEELRGLIDDYVTEEVLYREALALGLDRDDLVVRRRMRQKMEFLNEGLTDPGDPSEAELEAFLVEHAERFREPARVSFQQVFLAAGDDREATLGRARGALGRLRGPDAAEAPQGLGDPTLLPDRLEAASPREVAGTFGEDFAEALEGLPSAAWSGPIESGFGLHLVRVEDRQPGHLPELAAVRPAVEREWRAVRREEANARFRRELRERYEVEILMPGGDAAPAIAAGP